jgi:hypothetical protein
MKQNLLIAALTTAITVGATVVGIGQKRARVGRVCGNPNQPCSYAKNFQPHELPFDTGRNFVIANSEFFYAIVLESAKLKPDTSCEKAFPELQRLAVQALFPNNKVFVVRCPEPGSNYYSNVSQDASLMAIYAGKTLAEAKAFLKTVQATGKYKNVALRRMQAGINGT